MSPMAAALPAGSLPMTTGEALTQPYPHTVLEPALRPSWDKQGHLLLVLGPSVASETPIKPCLNFTSGL